MAGAGEVIAGFVFIFIFFITLSVASIPIIWTGALIVGISLVIRGLYHMAKSSGNTQVYNTGVLPNWVCPTCGYQNGTNSANCKQCGSTKAIHISNLPLAPPPPP